MERHQRGRGRPPDGGRAAKAKDRPTGVPPRQSKGLMLSCKPNRPAAGQPRGARQWGDLSVHRPGPRQGAAPCVPGLAPPVRPLAFAQPMPLPLPLLFLLFARSAHFRFGFCSCFCPPWRAVFKEEEGKCCQAAFFLGVDSQMCERNSH